MSVKGCPIPTPQRLSELDIDPNKQTEIERRINHLDSLLQQTSLATKTSAAVQDTTARRLLLEHMQEVGQMIEPIAIRSGDVGGLERFLVNQLGVSKNLLGLGNGYSKAGWVRQSLLRVRRLGSGSIARAVRKMAVVETVGTEYKQSVRLLKQRGVPSREITSILNEASELGWQRYFPRFFRIGKVGEQVLDGRVENFINRLRSTHGLGDADVQQIITSGRKVSDVYMKMVALGQQVGVGVSGNDELLAYLPRFFTGEARTRFNWRYQNLRRGAVEFDDSSTMSIDQVFTTSRASHEYVIEDEVLVDYLIRQYSKQKYDDPAAIYRRAGKIEDAGLGDVLGDHHALSSLLVETEGELLDSLVDSGLLSRLPLPSSEIVESLIKRYDLPFESLNEVFATDWQRGVTLYKQQLERLAGESGFVTSVIKNSIDGNWAVSRSEVLKNPGMYREFVPLVSYDRTDAVFTPQQLSRFGYSRARQEGMSLFLQEKYVHPTVAELVRTQLELQTDPMMLGVLDRFISGVTTRFKQLAITTLGYIPRQLYNTVFSQAAGGGDVLLVPFYTSKMLAAAVGRVPFESMLDDTKTLYRLADGTELTELGLWNHLSDVGYISRFEPLTGTELDSGFHNWNPVNVRRNIQWLANAADQNGGLSKLISEAGMQLGNVVDRGTYPLRWLNNVLDNAGRFSGIVSSLKRYDSNIPGLFAQRFRRLITGGWQQHPTVEQAIEHWQNYYFMYDDFTKLDQVIGKYVFPFWAFHSKNIPAAVRHLVQNPTRFMAYQRIYSLLNRPVASEDNPQLTESTVQPWLIQQQNIYFKTEDGYFAIPLEPLDPVAGAREWVEDPAMGVLSLFGIRPQRPTATSERLESAPWNETNQAINEMLDRTYGIWRAIAVTLKGEDTLGRSQSDNRMTTFWGYDVSPLTRTWLEALLPITGYINRLNPVNAFGTPPRRDARTGTWSPGTPSVMPFSGNPPRTDSDSASVDNPYRWLDYIGIKVYPVDTMLNAGYTYDDLRSNVREGENLLRTLRSDLVKIDENSSAYDRQLQRIAETEFLVSQTRNDMNRLQDWADMNGFDVRAAVSKLTELNRRVGDLPDTK